MYSNNDLIFDLPESGFSPQAQGNFAKHLLIVTSGGSNEALRAFLEKVFNAVQVQIANDALLLEITEASPVAITSFLREKAPRFVVVFGCTPEQLGLQIVVSPYQPFAFYDAQWLFADSLALLEPDRERKGKLWNALKALFV